MRRSEFHIVDQLAIWPHVPDSTLTIRHIKHESRSRKGIYYSGTKIYNALPLALKTEKYYVHFKSALKEHFMD